MRFIIAALVLSLTACGGGGGSGSGGGGGGTGGTPGVLAMRRVATGFDQPLFLTGAGDSSGRVLVVEKTGRVRVLTPSTGAVATNPFLDVSTQIATDGERGLLGLALSPDFASSRTFYVYLVNTSGGIEVRRYRTLATDPLRADVATADVILAVAHPPNPNHYGGWIGFGPDSMLWIAVGDGATGGAPAQDRNDLLGKILRIDPRSDAFPSDNQRDYAIPVGNPFSAPSGAPEVYAYGLRNPFRAGFDRQTGDLYIGDVGQNAVEEVDLLRAGNVDVGRNFGWPILEGTSTFAGGSTAGLAPPILQYPHGTGALQGNSVTGGYVYRGPIAQFRGVYVFGDFVNRRIWSIAAGSVVQGTTLSNTSFTDRTGAFAPDVGAIGNISSFGEDEAGNLFVVDFDGEIFTLREV